LFEPLRFRGALEGVGNETGGLQERCPRVFETALRGRRGEGLCGFLQAESKRGKGFPQPGNNPRKIISPRVFKGFERGDKVSGKVFGGRIQLAPPGLFP
jgi:hypothetical protein